MNNSAICAPNVRRTKVTPMMKTKGLPGILSPLGTGVRLSERGGENIFTKPLPSERLSLCGSKESGLGLLSTYF